MNKEYYIKLQAKIDDSSKTINELNKQIKTMETKLQNLELEVDTKGVEKAKNEFDTLDGALSKIGLTSKQLQDSFTDVKTKLTSSSKEVVQYKNNLGQVVEVTTRLNDGQKIYSATTITLNSSLAKNVTSISNLNAQYKTQDEVLKNLKVDLSEYQRISSQINSDGSITERWTNNSGKIVTLNGKMIDGQIKYIGSLKEVSSAVESNAKQADKWRYSWSKAFQSFTTYMSVTTVFYQIIHTIRDMIDEVTELDGALVELRKVTDLEGESLQKFTKEAYVAGADVAKTGTEMIEAATSFAKAGYSKDQILQLGKVATMYTNIADEAISSADAADFIIAQLKAFNLESDDLNKTLENSYHIIDAVNEVSNNFAVSSSDIATNLGKASSVMANAGNSMEQMIGIMTAGTEITRNASKVANGLKTITLRLQGMDDEGEENLELMSQMEGLFNKLGKTVYNTDGTLKNTYDLLGELADVYPSLTAAEKAYVTETIAGKYQAQNAAAILSNWKTAIDATATALDSQGSAMKENSKYVDSIKGKIAALSSEFGQLAQNVVGSNLVKFFLDLGNILLNLANSSFGKTTTLFTMLSAATLALRNGINFLNKSFSSLKLGIIDYYKYQVLLYAQSKNQTISNYAEAASYLGLAKSIKAVSFAIASNPLFIAGTAIAAFSFFSNKVDESKQKMAEMSQASQNASSSLDKLNSSLSSLTNDDISNLKEYKQVIEDATSTTTELSAANEGLKSIQGKLDDLFGKNSVNVYNNDIDETISKIQQLTADELKLYKVRNESALQDARNAKNKDINSDSIDIYHGDSNVEQRGFRDILGDISQQKDYGSLYFGHGSTYTRISGEAQDAMSFINDALNYVKTNRELIKEEYKYTDEELDDLQGSLSESYTKIEDEYKNHLDFLSNYYNTLLGYVDGGNEYNAEMKNASSDGSLTDEEIDNILAKYPEVKKLLKDVGYDYNDLRNIFIGSGKDISESSDTIKNAYDKVSEARQKSFNSNSADKLFGDLENSKSYSYINELYDGLKKIADEGELSAKSIKKFINSLGNWTVTGEEVIYDLDGTSVSLQDLITYFSVLNNKVKTSDEYFKEISKTLDDIQSAYDLATSAVKEYNNQGYLSIDTLQSLTSLDGEYLDLLFNEANQLSVNKDGFNNLAIAELNLLKIKQQEQLLKFVESLKGEGNQLSDNTQIVNNLTRALEKNNAELAKNIALSSVSGDFTAEEVSAIEKRVQSVIGYFKQVMSFG